MAATESRTSLMYVDIKRKSKGLDVVSPLKQTVRIDGALEEVESTLATLKQFIKLAPKLGYIFKKNPEDAEENDERFPKNPEWD